MTDRAIAVERLYAQLVEQVIKEIKELPENCRQSGDDSPLDTVWLEYAAQIQGQHSALYWAYVATIESICHATVQELSDGEITLLGSGGEDETADGRSLDEIIANLKERINERAVNLELPRRPSKDEI